ncbi:DUF2938 domain-containing protein [Metapseudomonas resinovorans]|uniref:DUF2938 domain-containing protein n=1 Tax=Metapseudomonas resinovorans NBRC 106553 TaxID=1245471 RepID=S6AH39_METRE|nr:DUF2938 domain-containing protein [Pseudomonas resinovorans]BAN47510.1 hypothetical protein PCA10_17780 [Pseudomonas resinovorans NBRC 106553]
MLGEMIFRVILVGVGATLATDIWAWLRRRLFGVPSLDYALVGRWLGHMGRGRFSHEAIGRAAPIAGERVLGWAFHYATGVVFAALLVALAGQGWLCRPSLLPAMLFGAATVAAPLLLMQPAFGMGLAASRTPQPGKARLRSLVTHLVFGAGLFVAAWAATGLGCA